MWRQQHHIRLQSTTSSLSMTELKRSSSTTPPFPISFSPTSISAPPLLAEHETPPFRPTSAFRLIYFSLLASCFLSALELTSVATALPSIAEALDSQDFTWVGSAYALTSTALIPWIGSMASIFGRRPTLISSLVAFAVGSALAGAAQNMSMLIVGRAVQGAGGGGILVMTDIVIVDLVPLAKRGTYYGYVGAVWALSSSIGPPVGGWLSSSGNWRWLFFLNIPISILGIILVALFLKVKVPPTTLSEKFHLIDYANIIFVLSTVSLLLGMTFGGTTFTWNSWHVLVPLTVGVIGIGLFIVVEKLWVKNPTVPWEMLQQRTTLTGFGTNFLHGVVVLAAIYFLPVYFQSTKGASAIRSGVDVFSLSFSIAPFAIFTGVSVAISGHYKTQNIIGWSLVITGFGLMTLLDADSRKVEWICYPFVLGTGLGILYTSTKFAVLAPLTPQQQPQAVAFFNFTRSLGQAFGISLGSTTLQNRLLDTLPPAFLTSKDVGQTLAELHLINTLPEPVKTQVRTAFATSLKTVWQVGAGIGGVGLFAVILFMRQVKLTQEVDERWGLESRRDREEKVGFEERREVVSFGEAV